MSISKVIDAADAVAVIRSGDVIATSGYGGHGVPEGVLVALEERFLDEGQPEDLTLVFAGGQGDSADRGLNHLGHEGMLARVIAGHYGLVPKIARLAVEEKLEAYNFPEGVLVHLYRNIARGAPRVLSKVGLGTFVDPRREGGKVNASATDDLVELVEFDDEEWLLYQGFPIDIALIRGTTADPEGNVTMEREALMLEALALSIAAKTSGGYVICQVERVAEASSLDSREVRIPGVMVDAVVVAPPEHHMQTFGTPYNPGMSGEIRVPPSSIDRLPLDYRTVIARRAAYEMTPDAVVNIGIGLPDLIGRVASEERIADLVTFTVDPGVIGGIPLGGFDFGGAVNRQAVIDHAAAFDFIDGGGLDAVFLGIAQCDGRGDVNVSRFDGRLAGCGGFINLTQRTQRIVFVTPFTSGGLEAVIDDGVLQIRNEGRVRKFVSEVEQITFSAARAASQGQDVLYITERCVFELSPHGLVLGEVAPGIDVDSDILSLLPFDVVVDDPRQMDPSLFVPGLLGLRDRMLDIRIEDRLHYDSESNTVFMDYSGLHVRTAEDVDQIVTAVDTLLGPVGHRVHSIVNYDRFLLDEDVEEAYADAVKYVADKYYLSVSRHATGGFTRLRLSNEFAKRNIEPALHESPGESAPDHG
ncbi:MAG: acyl CoA:acetate/3-ketoacid CoA transferase [Actinobacteria bacterium]|nr:MAG: acyl CoA:acetate/3-ketoacid CoA transferase [Actinomycetota bacterium]